MTREEWFDKYVIIDGLPKKAKEQLKRKFVEDNEKEKKNHAQSVQ